MEHFQNTVPLKVQKKLKDIANSIDLSTIAELCDSEQVSEISGVGYDGFIPFQRGGFEVNAFIDSGYNSGVYLIKEQEEFSNNIYNNIEKDFKKDNNIKEDAVLTDEQDDELSCMMYDYIDLDLLRVEMWVEDDTDEIFLRLSLNYKDAPYYRSKNDDTLNELTLSYKELLAKNKDDIIKDLLKFKIF